MLEAPRRQELAELATQAVSAVEDLIEEVRLLPAIADLVAVPS